MKNDEQQVSIRIDREIYKRLCIDAVNKGVSRKFLITEAIQIYLDMLKNREIQA